MSYPHVTCINELTIVSDHTPMVLLIQGDLRRKRRMFRFEKMLMENPEYESVIKNA